MLRKILTLPGDAAQISLQATLVDQRDTAPRLHGRILVVDDEPDIVTILTKYFTDAGLSVDAASHGGDALIAVSQYRPDVVLLDVLMEGLNGVQVLERIRALDPAIRVIMISGSGDSTLRPRALAMGAFAYVPKPLSLPDLHRAVSAALAQPGSSAPA
ncbi:MAG: response regulator [Candidatus Rokuibacteriota bacterium]|nr:MAG: response regulator [Candidatus Rokubacteria bacterium]PYN53813.1 MAG: response regulator [Candidatus Rokubacteria bacterium]